MKSQPKVFVGNGEELIKLADANWWKLEDITLIGRVADVDLVRRLKITKDDVMFGESSKHIPQNVFWFIERALNDIYVRNYDPEIKGDADE